MATASQWRRVLLRATELRQYGDEGDRKADEIIEKAGGRIMADPELTPAERNDLLVEALVVTGASF